MSLIGPIGTFMINFQYGSVHEIFIFTSESREGSEESVQTHLRLHYLHTRSMYVGDGSDKS